MILLIKLGVWSLDHLELSLMTQRRLPFSLWLSFFLLFLLLAFRSFFVFLFLLNLFWLFEILDCALSFFGLVDLLHFCDLDFAHVVQRLCSNSCSRAKFDLYSYSSHDKHCCANPCANVDSSWNRRGIGFLRTGCVGQRFARGCSIWWIGLDWWVCGVGWIRGAWGIAGVCCTLWRVY